MNYGDSLNPSGAATATVRGSKWFTVPTCFYCPRIQRRLYTIAVHICVFPGSKPTAKRSHIAWELYNVAALLRWESG